MTNEEQPPRAPGRGTAMAGGMPPKAKRRAKSFSAGERVPGKTGNMEWSQKRDRIGNAAAAIAPGLSPAMEELR